MSDKSEMIRVGVIGGGYMGKAHAVAARVASTNAELGVEIRLEGVAASTPESAKQYMEKYGFRHAFESAESLLQSDQIDAVIIASPQSTHLRFVKLAAKTGKAILCEKPMGRNIAESQSIVELAGNLPNLVGYNYIQTPATALAKKLLDEKTIGEIIWYRGEHHEDFLVNAEGNEWRKVGDANGTLGDLMPHPIHNALTLAGPIAAVIADMKQHSKVRNEKVNPDANDDQVQCMCTFANGANGFISASRVAHGKKMGLTYEVHGTEGALRFDQEDQNSLHLYRANQDAGFQRILAAPGHGQYSMFCQGPGHGTGYQDQIIIEQVAFYRAILGIKPASPSFKDGLEVMKVCTAIRQSYQTQSWTVV